MSRTPVPIHRAALGTPGALPLFFELRRTLRGCRTVLDLGCGNNSPLATLRTQVLTGLEGYPPALEEARKRGTHDDLVAGDVCRTAALFEGRRFDACVALDLIEHLTKEDGCRLLEDLERITNRRVVIFTPNGFLPQRGHGDLQEHLSGWTPGEMRARGYRVIGFYGLKSLRGEYHRLKYRPKMFWAVMSVLSQALVARHRPECAAAIYCVKDLDQHRAQPGGPG